MYFTCVLAMVLVPVVYAKGIDRHLIVSRYNPTRNTSSLSTPMQVGNGNFAFGADATGMQTFQPFNIMSSWAWKNDSLPEGKSLEDVETYHGTSWDNHGHLVQYNFGGDDKAIEQWLISNPNRVNLGRIGWVFKGGQGETLNLTESDLVDVHQELDLWSGTLTSRFIFDGQLIEVNTTSAHDSDTVYFTISSNHLLADRLAIFVDFPWSDGLSKFSAPFVGVYNMTANHTTDLSSESDNQILHSIGSSSFYTSVIGDSFNLTRDSADAHRYTIQPTHSKSVNFSIGISFSLDPAANSSLPESGITSAAKEWENYWSESGFVDIISESTNVRADELQRRIILSRYLMRVNEAGGSPPQEVGSATYHISCWNQLTMNLNSLVL
jgi:hypothetical protein